MDDINKKIMLYESFLETLNKAIEIIVEKPLQRYDIGVKLVREKNEVKVRLHQLYTESIINSLMKDETAK